MSTIINATIPMTVSTAVKTMAGPHYEGGYNFEPTHEPQIIPTKDKIADDNFTFGAIPPEYIIPAGEMEISENGEYDVTEYESVNVGIFPQPKPFDNFGVDTEFVGYAIDENFKFSETAWDTWTPATSAALALGHGNDVSIICDLAHYTYWVVPTIKVDYKYVSGTALKTIGKRYFASALYECYGYSNASAVKPRVINSALRKDFFDYALYRLFAYYGNTTGVLESRDITCGMYATGTGSVTFPTSGIADPEHVEFKIARPDLWMLCNSSYFTTAQARKVDKELSTIEYKVAVYRTPNAPMRAISGALLDWIAEE